MAQASQAEIDRLAALVSAYQQAELSVLRNQSYRMPDGRELTRANLNDILAGKKRAEADYKCALGLSNAKGRVRRAVNMTR